MHANQRSTVLAATYLKSGRSGFPGDPTAGGWDTRAVRYPPEFAPTTPTPAQTKLRLSGIRKCLSPPEELGAIPVSQRSLMHQDSSVEQAFVVGIMDAVRALLDEVERVGIVTSLACGLASVMILTRFAHPPFPELSPYLELWSCKVNQSVRACGQHRIAVQSFSSSTPMQSWMASPSHWPGVDPMIGQHH
jgi:hypothetical protein